jgi:hypothetical protein
LISRRSIIHSRATDTGGLCATLALCAALVAGAAISALAIEYNEFRLSARIDGDLLHVSAPNFSFLNGKPLERLKDGASVAFIAQLSVSTSPNYLVADQVSVARFAVSYDIWDEHFSITKITDHADQKRTVSHLPGPAAEAWCFNNLPISRSDLPADKPFYLQLDFRVEDPRDQAHFIGPGGISVSLQRMLEVLSRPAYDKQAHWLLKSGPLRLEELQRMHG